MTRLRDGLGGCLLAMMALLGLASSAAARDGGDAAGREASAAVEATEAAFAATMAARDFDAFQEFVDEEAVFLSGEQALRGRQAVVERWRSFFEGPAAPFSWEPETVEVLASGALALSTGPVYDGDGTLVATFTSIWRRDESGEWKIVFDRGNDVCAQP